MTTTTSLPKFYVGDRVQHPTLGNGTVTGYSKPRDWPDLGPVRKVNWETPKGADQVSWDFELEAW